MTSTHALPKGRFTAVLAAPPWNFRTRSAKGRNRCPDGQGHYKVMSLADIKALPVGALTAPDSALFLWVVDCKISELTEVRDLLNEIRELMDSLPQMQLPVSLTELR